MTPTRTLHLANGLNLPLDTVTQTIAILAKRRAGKSYTMRRLVEQLFKAGQQVVVVDPKGDQWGLRSASDGKGPGLPIVILGGERGDAPLDVHAGEVVAKLAVEERVSVLLDLSLFRKREVAVFMTDFLENLYRLKAREVFRTPMMLIVDEADAIAPQKPQPGEERMLGAIEDIVRRGGQRGIGCVVVTQRSAVLNKNVLTQAQILVALRTIAPQDLKAMKEWIDVHGEESQRRTLMDSLPALPIGDAWFWSPGWPTVDGIFKRVHVLPIETFDSGKSPEPGAKPVEPKNLADVDLDAIRRQMAATIEKAKADDPRELRKLLQEKDRKIQSLEKQVAQPCLQPSPNKEPIRQPVLTDTDRALLEKVAVALTARADQARETISIADGALDRAVQKAAAEHLSVVRQVGMDAALHVEQTLDRAGLRKVLDKLATVQPVSNRGNNISAPRHVVAPAATRPARTAPAAASTENGLSRAAERKCLTVLAQYPDGRSVRQVAILAGYAMNGGGFRNAIGRLRALGYIDGRGDALRATSEGLAALGAFEPLPTGPALAEHWLRQLDRRAEREILQVLLDAYPKGLTPESIARATPTQYEPNGGGFRNALGKLRTLELIEGRGELRASSELFS